MTTARIALVLIFGMAVGGCSGVVTANNRELLRAQTLMVSGQPRDALAALDASKRDDLCAKLDRALYKSALGDVTGGNAEYDRAITEIRGYENRATVSATETTRGAGSLLINDKLLEYQGQGFEKVLVHAMKARNYLLLGDSEAARVEIRNANMRQDQERKRHQDVIDAANKEGKKQQIDMGKLSNDVDARFADSSAILRRLDNVYQNPFATYLSGIVYELNGETGDAFIDYKKANQMVPGAQVVANDLARLAATLHRKDEVVGVKLPKVDAKTPAGNTLVILDNGFAPQKVEIKFPIPIPNNVLFAAVPITRPVPTALGDAEIVGPDGRVLGRTEMLVDVEGMAVRDLHDQYPAIIVRQTIRAVAKGVGEEAARRSAANQSAAAGLAVELTNITINAVTEQADLRGWYALPRSIHVARVTLPNDAKEVTLRMLDNYGGVLSQITAPVVASGPTMKIVAVRWIDGRTLFAAPAAAQGKAVASTER
jgi:hypothetical protein